jgi:predicted DNA-binding ribbon-helix-helix protein
MLVKRSIALSGHRTSIALEPEFWAALDAIAASGGQSTSALIRAVDENRNPRQALASALRVLALRDAPTRRTGPA